MRPRLIDFLIAIIIPSVLLSGCRFSSILQRSTPTPTATATATATATWTLTPSPTDTSTPTATSTPTETPTPTPELLVPAGMPLPSDIPFIIVENAANVSGLTSWQEQVINYISWLPASDSLGVATTNGIAIYNVQNQTQTSFIDTGEGLVNFAFSPGGTWLATSHRLGDDQSGFTGYFHIWRSPKWDSWGAFGDSRPVSAVAFSPSDYLMAAAFTSTDYWGNSVDFYNTLTWEVTQTLYTGTVLEIAYSASGGTLASVPDRYAINIWDTKSGDLLYKLPTSFTGAINCLTFSPNGDILATGHYDGSIRIIDAKTGQSLKNMSTTGIVESLVFSPDGHILATGESYDSTAVKLWRVETGELLRTLEGHTHGVDFVTFSPDGKFLASASYDGTIRIWGIRP
ncbi:MAG: WD40 repeat domain-containing protein [Anaerolineales bacterium]|nr:WD40 repeat domain-containing protein [Anaerolineales bacterium]